MFLYFAQLLNSLRAVRSHAVERVIDGVNVYDLLTNH